MRSLGVNNKLSNSPVLKYSCSLSRVLFVPFCAFVPHVESMLQTWLKCQEESPFCDRMI